jgi:lysophospholipase L1-like esterase
MDRDSGEGKPAAMVEGRGAPVARADAVDKGSPGRRLFSAQSGQRARRVVIAAWLVLSAASLVANVILARGWLASTRRAHVARLDPAELGTYAAERAKSPPGGPVLLFFGDSRSLMWPAPDGVAPYVVVNRGIGYQTTAQIALRIDADVVPLHPAVIVLEAGVNDLKAIADVPERRAAIVAECEANLRRIVERLRATGATIVLVSIFDIGDVPAWRAPIWSDEVAAAVREVNGFLPGLARDGVVLFEAGPVLDDARGKVKPEYQLDHLHLLPSGYLALDEKLVPLVRSLPRR